MICFKLKEMIPNFGSTIFGTKYSVILLKIKFNLQKNEFEKLRI